MPERDPSMRYRSWSWFLAGASFVLPIVLFALQIWLIGRSAAAQDRYLCGLAVLLPLALSVLASFVLSLAALYCSLRSYYKLGRPRQWARLIEAPVVGSASILLTCMSALAWLLGSA